MTALEWSTNEMMAVALSRELHDGEIGFIGFGSSGRAFELVTKIPILAALLAQRQGRDFRLQVGPLIGVDIEQPPPGFFDNDLYSWRADALIASDANMDHFIGGRVSVGFISGAQIDRFGNVNISRVGASSGWKRLGGALALPEHCAFAGRAILLADLHPRVFVESVDFVTGFGHRRGNLTRADLGLPGGGPVLAVTDHGLIRYGRDGAMLEGLYPGVALEEFDARLSYAAERPDDVPVVAAPTTEELDIIRSLELPPLPW
jgi:glutaconate CoA-transferase, subunit B